MSAAITSKGQPAVRRISARRGLREASTSDAGIGFKNSPSWCNSTMFDTLGKKFRIANCELRILYGLNRSYKSNRSYYDETEFPKESQFANSQSEIRNSRSVYATFN